MSERPRNTSNIMGKPDHTSGDAFSAGHERGHEAASITDPFRRPDAAILSPAIPLFFIGRNRNGMWVARDADASSGGLFLLKSSAMRFARSSRPPLAPAIIMRTSRFELDTPNSGNRYAGQLAILTNKLQLFARALRQIGVYLLRLAVTPLRKIRWLFAARRIHQAAIRLTGRP